MAPKRNWQHLTPKPGGRVGLRADRVGFCPLIDPNPGMYRAVISELRDPHDGPIHARSVRPRQFLVGVASPIDSKVPFTRQPPVPIEVPAYRWIAQSIPIPSGMVLTTGSLEAVAMRRPDRRTPIVTGKTSHSVEMIKRPVTLAYRCYRRVIKIEY